MDAFYDTEGLCQDCFDKLGQCWHLWTDEDHEIIFRNEDDYKMAMAIIAMASMLFPNLKVLTFEIMSNHLHMALAGKREEVLALFEKIVSMIKAVLNSEGRLLSLKNFNCHLRMIESLSDCRNTIVYINRNGYVARPDHSPITYPWGANSCFYNNSSFQIYETSKEILTWRQRLAIAHTHDVDPLKHVMSVNEVVSPWCFCYIREAEQLFRGAAHYFFCLSKNIEANKQIASEIGERVYYTDDELFALLTAMAARKYSTQLKLLSREAKIDLAKSIHYEYNATCKQISRMLKLDINVVTSLFPKGR
ncbi:MAG: hypothetical protein MJZ07_03835 [Bacteroidales bacterium]|nr:hypothetical protein [Bacteroidales bacterium]